MGDYATPEANCATCIAHKISLESLFPDDSFLSAFRSIRGTAHSLGTHSEGLFFFTVRRWTLASFVQLIVFTLCVVTLYFSVLLCAFSK